MSHNGITLQIETLQGEREQTLFRLNRLRQTLKSEIEPEVEEGDFELEAHEIAVLLIQELERKLEAIDGALQQLQLGAYGLCKRCGQPIDPARLEALPETTFCLNCKIIVEQQNRITISAARFDWDADEEKEYDL